MPLLKVSNRKIYILNYHAGLSTSNNEIESIGSHLIFIVAGISIFIFKGHLYQILRCTANIFACNCISDLIKQLWNRKLQ